MSLDQLSGVKSQKSIADFSGVLSIRAFMDLRLNFCYLTVAALAFTSSVSADDWTQYRGSNHDGTSSEKLIQKQWPSRGPKVLWKTDNYPLGFSSFTVKGDRAFTVCGRDGKEVAVAMNADTGRELWSHVMTTAEYGHDGGNAGSRTNKGGDGPRSTPSIDDGRVYVMSADLVLYCLDEKTGEPIWQRDLIRQNHGRNIKWENAASPLVDGDLVFVAGGGTGQALLALNKVTGKVVWAGEDDLMTHSTPVVTDLLGTRQVIFFTQTGLVSCDVQDGSVLWRYGFKFAISTAITPVVGGEMVYCSAGYGVGSAVVRVHKENGAFAATELWRIVGHKDVANHWSTPVHHEGYLYGMFSFKKYERGPLKCVQLSTGKVMWEQEGFGAGNAIIVDGHVAALSDSGQLVLVEAKSDSYEEVARAKLLEGKCWTTPVISNGRVYVRSTKEAACIDLSGKVAAR